MIAKRFFSARYAWVGTIVLFASAGRAVPPPPVPSGRMEASSSLARVATILNGAWRGQESGTTNRVTELKVGRFGPEANYLLIGRVVHIPQGDPVRTDVQVYSLSALVYSVSCKAFEMISLDRVGENPRTGSNCVRAFPIITKADGSLTFEYLDPNDERVAVRVDSRSWRETIITTPSLQRYAGGFTVERVARDFSWGYVP